MSSEVYVESALLMFFGIMVVVLLVSLAVSIVSYVLQSIGLYSIARRRGIKHPWLAWIPVGEFWIIGSISQDYRLQIKGQLSNRRGLMVVFLGITTVYSLFESVLSLEEVWLLWQYGQGNISAAQLEREITLTIGNDYSLVVNSLFSLVISGLAIAGSVFYYMSLYDLYASCRPRQKVVFLVLSFLGLAPFFIFACRKHDYGMQPPVPQYPYWNGGYPQMDGNLPGYYPPQNPQLPDNNWQREQKM